MNNKTTIMQVLGSLMRTPQLLSEIDKYSLTPYDFQSTFEKYIFIAIDSLYKQGAKKISPIDVENFLETNSTGQLIFKESNGIEYLNDAAYLSDENNFPYYYNKLKKINLLRDFNKMGIDTSDFYIENELDEKAIKVNKEFENLTIEDIIGKVKVKLLKVEKEYSKGERIQSWNLADEIDEVIDNFGSVEEIGLPINGKIVSTVINGAELGALTIRSACSGLGKTRLAVADACKLAFPFYYDLNKNEWVKSGNSEPTLFIMTEQKPEQIMRMVLAYLSGIEENRFRFANFTDSEKQRIKVAKKIIKEFNTLKLMRIPDPTIELIKISVREEVMVREIKYVFFDYIFISPGVLNEFRGHGLRNDEVLLLMATALKDLAIEQNVSVFTSTQVNANADNNTDIRNESSLAGGRATINKADNGMIAARPTKDEIEILSKEGNLLEGNIPNIVFDIFKVRSGRWTQIRIWSIFDTGTLRLEDLFVTDSRMNIIENFFNELYYVSWDMTPKEAEVLKEINNDRV